MDMSTINNLIVGLAVVAVLGIQLHFQRKQNNERMRLEREKYELARDQQIQIGKIVEPVSEKIAENLRINNNWAATALERARIGPYSNSPFGDRLDHFLDEKIYIAKRFAPMLMERCKYLIEKRDVKHIYILIDSGTTTYHLFKEVGLIAAIAYNSKEKWVYGDGSHIASEPQSSITVVTNNIPGIFSLMQHGRPNPIYRHSTLAVNCLLIPGFPTPVYAAVLGSRTQAYTKDLLESIQQEEGVMIISIVTGNWLRIRDTTPHCALPLSRGHGHNDFKELLIGNTDEKDNRETYILSPLGKIFGHARTNDIAVALETDDTSGNPDRKRYEDIKIDSVSVANRTKLVTTSREEQDLLYPVSAYIRAQLFPRDDTDLDSFRSAEIGKTTHLMFQRGFKYPDDKHSEREMEFPHAKTCNDRFINYFRRPDLQRDKRP